MLPQPHDPAHRPVRFELAADADPGLLARLLAPFARRNLVPDQMRSRRQGATLRVEIGINAMPTEMLHLVEGNLRQIVGVHRLAVVLTTRAQEAGAQAAA
jgi:hypothetical protein